MVTQSEEVVGSGLHVRSTLTFELFTISGNWLTLGGQPLQRQQDPDVKTSECRKSKAWLLRHGVASVLGLQFVQ